MSTQQYNVLKATPAGEPWLGQGGGWFQSYFIDLEGYDRNTVIMCNRKQGNPAPLGPTWGDLVANGTTQKGKPKMKFTVGTAPDGSYGQTTPQSHPQPAQQALPLSNGNDSISWGEAVVAACSAAAWLELSGMNGILDFARALHGSKPVEVIDNGAPTTEVKTAQQVATDAFSDGRPVTDDLGNDEPVDLSEIPF